MWSTKFKKRKWMEGGQGFAEEWYCGARRVLSFLLYACDPRFGPSADEGAVAWLNGLRGFAAFLVYCDHHSKHTVHGDNRQLWHAFGYDGEYYFACLPFVRWFCSGGGKVAVTLFFTISGFVLSYSPLRTIQKRPDDLGNQIATKIGTAFARRWLRLFLPVIATTFVVMSSWHIFGVRSGEWGVAAPAPTYYLEFRRWVLQFIDGSYIFHTRNAFGKNDYNSHVWSIAVEYRGSLLIYLWCLGMFAIKWAPRKRFWATLALFLYFQYAVGGHGPWYSGFVQGMLICDLTVVSALDPSQVPKLFRLRLFRKHTWPHYVMLFVGIYLASCPLVGKRAELAEQPGWYLLSFLTPDGDVTWYFCIFGSALMITAVPNLPRVLRFFESWPIQYLGKISFGLYLVHGPILWTVGDRLYAAVGRPGPRARETVPNWINAFPITNAGPLGMELNSILPQLILLPLSLWLAIVVTKAIDTPSMNLSKWFFGQSKRESGKSAAFSLEAEGLLSRHEDRLPL